MKHKKEVCWNLAGIELTTNNQHKLINYSGERQSEFSFLWCQFEKWQEKSLLQQSNTNGAFKVA